MVCHHDEFVAAVARLIGRGAPRAEIEQLLSLLSPQYRAEILAAAASLADEQPAAKPVSEV